VIRTDLPAMLNRLVTPLPGPAAAPVNPAEDSMERNA
jgi:hypothetical protein